MLKKCKLLLVSGVLAGSAVALPLAAAAPASAATPTAAAPAATDSIDLNLAIGTYGYLKPVKVDIPVVVNL